MADPQSGTVSDSAGSDERLHSVGVDAPVVSSVRSLRQCLLNPADDQIAAESFKSEKASPDFGEVSPLFLEALRRTVRDRQKGDTSVASEPGGILERRRPQSAMAALSQTKPCSPPSAPPPVRPGNRRGSGGPKTGRAAQTSVTSEAIEPSKITEETSDAVKQPQTAETPSTAVAPREVPGADPEEPLGSEKNRSLGKPRGMECGEGTVREMMSPAPVSPAKFLDPRAERAHFMQALEAMRRHVRGDGGYASVERKLPPRPQSAVARLHAPGHVSADTSELS